MEVSTDPDHARPTASKKWVSLFQKVSPVFAFLLIALALVVIYRELAHYSWGEIHASLQRVRFETLLLCCCLAVVSFTCLGVVEWFAVRMLNGNLSFGTANHAAFVTYGASNALGYAFATAPAARARLYRGTLSARQVGGLSVLTALSVTLGAMTAAGISTLAAANSLPPLPLGGATAWSILGVLLCVPAVLWWLLSVNTKGSIKILGLSVRTLGPLGSAAQIAFTTIDWLATASILHFLLPSGEAWPFPAFAVAFIAAGTLGAVSGTPGGIGAFEATILAAAPASMSGASVAAALLVYRVIFTLVPLLIATILLAVDFRSRR